MIRGARAGFQCIRPIAITISASSLLGSENWGRWRGRRQGYIYHVECNDIFEGNLSGVVFLDEDLVDEDWTRSSWKTEDEWVLWCWVEVLDSVFGSCQ
jgi:hypothetical protein